MRPQALTRLALLAAVVLLAAPAAAQVPVCQDPNNMTTNCGFDTDIAGWTQVFGTFSWEPGDGNDAPGCMEVLSETLSNMEWLVFNQCISPVAPATTYGFGGFVKLVSGGPPLFCEVNSHNYDSPDCSGNSTSSQSVSLYSFSGGWDRMDSSLTTDGATQSVKMTVGCLQSGGVSYTVRFDDLFFGVGLVPVELQSFTVE